MRSKSPACSVHALDLAALRAPTVTFYTAWMNNELQGCGALSEIDHTHAELKSMRTATASLRQGVASALLHHLVNEAHSRGYHRLSLETGSQPGFQAARLFYERHGFSVTTPFASYTDDPNSIYYTRVLL